MRCAQSPATSYLSHRCPQLLSRAGPAQKACAPFRTEPPYALVIRGGRVATTSDVFEADVAIVGETIAAIGRELPTGKREIDARGKLVLPGGVDSHAHIEQLSAAGIMNADTFESATTSEAFGGTTTVISFAAQHVGMALPQVVADYHALAKKGAVIDYAFHMIIADPTAEALQNDIPAPENLPRLFSLI